VKLGVK